MSDTTQPPPSLNSAIGPGPKNVPSDNALSPDSIRDYDPSKNQDKVRSNIAYWLVAGLLFVIFVYCAAGVLGAGNCALASDCKNVTESLAVVREFLSVALASITGLVGAVTGFYFGAQTARKA